MLAVARRAAACAGRSRRRCWSPCWPRRRCTARWCSARSTRCCWSGWSPAGSPSGAAGRCWPRCCTGSRWRSSRRSAPVLLLPAVQRRWLPLRAGLASPRSRPPARGAGRRPVQRAVEWLRDRVSEPVPDTVDNASLPGLAVRFGLPSVIGHAARGRGAGRHPGLVRAPPGPDRPGRHRAVRGARRRAALLPDLLAQLPDAALARRADADRARPRRGGRGGAGGHRRSRCPGTPTGRRTGWSPTSRGRCTA